MSDRPPGQHDPIQWEHDDRVQVTHGAAPSSGACLEGRTHCWTFRVLATCVECFWCAQQAWVPADFVLDVRPRRDAFGSYPQTPIDPATAPEVPKCRVCREPLNQWFVCVRCENEADAVKDRCRELADV